VRPRVNGPKRQTVRVPVAREDVGGRRAPSGRSATGRARAAAVRVPVKEERVRTSKAGGTTSRNTRSKR
jgi:hypothetical protein